MPEQTPDRQPDREDTDAGYRDTLEEEAYEQDEPMKRREASDESDESDESG